MNSLHQYIQQGIRLSNDTVAIESLAAALSINPSGANSRANTLINVATESFCARWGIPRVVIATESFQTSAAKQASIVACEGVKEMVANAWRKFVEWLRGLIAKFKALFKKKQTRIEALRHNRFLFRAMVAANKKALNAVTIEGNWPYLVIDNKVDFNQVIDFLSGYGNNIITLSTRLMEQVRGLEEGQVISNKLEWEGKATTNHKAKEVTKGFVAAYPSNKYLIVNQEDGKTRLEFKHEEVNDSTIKDPIKISTESIEIGLRVAIDHCGNSTLMTVLEEITNIKDIEAHLKNNGVEEADIKNAADQLRTSVTNISRLMSQSSDIVLSTAESLVRLGMLYIKANVGKK